MMKASSYSHAVAKVFTLAIVGAATGLPFNLGLLQTPWAAIFLVIGAAAGALLARILLPHLHPIAIIMCISMLVLPSFIFAAPLETVSSVALAVICTVCGLNVGMSCAIFMDGSKYSLRFTKGNLGLFVTLFLVGFATENLVWAVLSKGYAHLLRQFMITCGIGMFSLLIFCMCLASLHFND